MLILGSVNRGLNYIISRTINNNLDDENWAEIMLNQL